MCPDDTDPKVSGPVPVELDCGGTETWLSVSANTLTCAGESCYAVNTGCCAQE